MLISIIIPVYNVAPYVERCLQSVINQTYKDLEVLIIDDCGTDNSMEIVERLLLSFPFPFRMLRHEHNRGLSAARNTGIAAATGEYLYFMDSDDELTSNCIEALVKEVRKHPEVELVQGCMRPIPYGKQYDLSRYKNISYKEDNIWIRKEFYRTSQAFPVNAPNRLLKTSFIRKNNLTFMEGIIHEDELWSFYLVKVLNKYSIVQDVTYLRYYNEGSIMTSTPRFSAKANKNWAIILEKIIPDFDEPCLNGQILRYLQEFGNRYSYDRKLYYSAFKSFLKLFVLYKRYASAALLCFTFVIGQHRGINRITNYLFRKLNRPA